MTSTRTRCAARLERAAAVLAVAIFALAFASAAYADPPTTLDFEATPPATGTALTNQYAGQGLNFVVDGSQGFKSPIVTDLSRLSPPLTAHSGDRAVELNGADEIPIPKMEAEFVASTRSQVSLWVRAGSVVAGGDAQFTLAASTTDGSPLSDTETVPASGAWTELSVTAASPTITGFTLVADSPATQGPFYVDDITFDNPASTTPDFTLRSAGPAVTQQGLDSLDTIYISRYGPSSGGITFSSPPSLPGGVSVDFSPVTAQPSDNSVTVTFHVSELADPGTYPITFSPSYDSSAGPAGKNVTVELMIERSCGDPSYGIVKLVPMNGGCFHPMGDNTYNYVGDTLRLNGIVAHVTGFHVDDNAHRLDAALFTIDTGSHVPGGGPGIPVYSGPLDAEVPMRSDGSAPLVSISSDGLSNLLAPFTASSDEHNSCSSDGSGAGGGGSGSGESGGCTPGSLTDTINLTDKGAEAPLELKLPAVMGGLTADVTLKWKNATGFDSDFGYKIKLGRVPFAGMVFQPFELDHTGPGAWSGTMGLRLGDPFNFSFAGSLGWDRSGVTEVAVSVTGVHIPFVDGSFITSANLGFRRFENSVLHYGFTGGLGVSWGPQVSGHSLAEVDGDVTFDWGDLNTSNPTGRGGTYWPFLVTVTAHVKIAGIDIGNGSVTVAQDQYGFTFRLEATVGVGLPYVEGQNPDDADVAIDGHLLGWIQPPNFDAQASVELKILQLRIAGADLLVSSEGWGACVHFFFFSGGFGQHWGHSVDVLGPFGCDISGYAPAYRDQGPGSARDAAAQSVHLLRYPRGSKPVFLKLIGAGGPPKVTLTGPGGRRLVMPAHGIAPMTGHQFVVLQSAKQHLTFIAINHPAGTWRLATESGSPAIVKALGATTIPPTKVSARITGAGRRHALVYSIASRPHQTVQFAELGMRTHRIIGTAHGRSGRISFTPGAGPAGRRTIEAIVSMNGVPQQQFAVAHYSAPRPPRPRDPSAVRVTHNRTGTVVVSGRRGAQVDNYRVVLKLGDGVVRFAEVPGSARQARFTRIPQRLSVTASVQAQFIGGALGKIVGQSSRRTTHR